MDIDAVIFEAEEHTVTLRIEEWVTVVTALELMQGGQALPIDPEVLARVQERIFPQLPGHRLSDEAE